MSNFLHSLFSVLEIATQDISHVGESVCTEPGVMKALRFIGYLLYVFKFFVPVLIIVWGTFDLYKAISGGSSDSISKQAKILLWRAVIGLGIFLLPSVINWVVSTLWQDEDSNAQCIQCVLQPFECES